MSADLFRGGFSRMSRPGGVPSYRLHKQSGQAIVTLPDGPPRPPGLACRPVRRLRRSGRRGGHLRALDPRRGARRLSRLLAARGDGGCPRPPLCRAEDASVLRQRAGDQPQAPARRQPGERYRPEAYAQVVRKACLKAGVEPWAPNQLRHTHGTEVRRLFGLEAAQAVLGHARADVTQVYAERNLTLAVRVAAELG